MATLLIVDDEPDVLEVFDLLLSHAGHVVRVAADAGTAVEIALTTSIDLIITDLMMPHVDGLTLCQRLRCDERTRAIPIILHSAAAQPPPGAGELYDAYLPKLAEFEEQIRLINRLLDSRPLHRRTPDDA